MNQSTLALTYPNAVKGFLLTLYAEGDSPEQLKYISGD